MKFRRMVTVSVRLAERGFIDFDGAVSAQAHDVDCAGIFGRAGIMGRDSAVAHRGRLIPMSKRDIVGAGRKNFFAVNQP